MSYEHMKSDNNEMTSQLVVTRLDNILDDSTKQYANLNRSQITHLT